MNTLEIFKGTIPAYKMLNRPGHDINYFGNMLIYGIQCDLKKNYDVVRAPALASDWMERKYKRQYGIIGTDCDLTDQEWADIITVINKRIDKIQRYLDGDKLALLI